MNFARIFLVAVPAFVVAACEPAESDSPDNGAAGAGGSASGGGSSGSSTGGASTGGASTAGATTGGVPTSAGAQTTGGSAGSATGGANPTAGTGGVSAGGTPSGGAAGAVTGGAPGGPLVEDDGADCSVGALPDAGTANAKLPDPFKKLDGTRIASKADWRCRRQEIRKLAEKHALGTKPGKPQMVSGSVTSTSISVNVSDSGKTASFSATVKLPTGGSAPYAAVIVYASPGFSSPMDAGTINSEGVALITYNPYNVGKETSSRSPKQGAFYDIAGSTSSTGLLAAWAWGVSRIIDVIEQSDGKILRASAVGVTGCSRFGKGSFLAGVLDQRVALTMPVESGTAGVPIWRGIPGEGAQGLLNAYNEQPWFGDAFKAFTGSPTTAPIDTHELVAMVAPRGLFIMDNPHIANLGPKSASVAALAGAEVYKALGAGDNITYFSDVSGGGHCSERPEWAAPLKSNIRKFLNKTGTDAGAMKISSKAAGKLADWVDWQTPTLQ